MPHKPLACSEAFYKKSGAGLYGDVMAELDASVGQVLAKLKELGLDENTLVIFTSDNGPWYGGSTGGLRGMKGTTWEGGYRVPCIARWPGRIPAGQGEPRPAVTMDLFATALAAAGVRAARRIASSTARTCCRCSRGKAKSPHDVIFGHQGDTAGHGARRPLEAARLARPRPQGRQAGPALDRPAGPTASRSSPPTSSPSRRTIPACAPATRRRP